MALNKKQTPTWVKGVIIFVAVSFVIGFIPIVITGFGGTSASNTGNTGDPTSVTGIAANYQPRIDALNASLQANPENVSMMTDLGHAYYEYAADLSNNGQSAAAAPLWVTAISFYDRVLAKEPDNAVLLGNKAFASVYSNSAGAKAALEAFIATNEPSLAAQIEQAKTMLETVNAAGSTATTGTP